MSYDKSTFTYGYEIEWGDIDRRLEVPNHLGAWEYAETDIVNVTGPFAGMAVDPLGLVPPHGGEINTRPTKTWQAQVDRIMELHQLFVDHGNQPSASCVNHGHLHVHVPGLMEDIDALKRLMTYIKANQADTVELCYGFYQTSDMTKMNATSYLKLDGGRLMPDWMCDNIIQKATDFKDFIRLHAAGKDGVSMGRPFRYAINTYCLKHTRTVEFRCFRSTILRNEIESQFRFAEKFIDAALNDGPSVREIVASGDYQFPKFVWSPVEFKNWSKTKYDKSRGNKQREIQDAV